MAKNQDRIQILTKTKKTKSCLCRKKRWWRKTKTKSNIPNAYAWKAKMAKDQTLKPGQIYFYHNGNPHRKKVKPILKSQPNSVGTKRLPQHLALCEILWRFFFVFMFTPVNSFSSSPSPGPGSYATLTRWKRSGTSSTYLKKSHFACSIFYCRNQAVFTDHHPGGFFNLIRTQQVR